MVKQFRKKHKGKHIATLTKLITGVHNQKPHYGETKKDNHCEYCKWTKGEKHENTAAHETECKDNIQSYEKAIEKYVQLAKDQAKLGTHAPD
jgi:hypothetical protein